MSNYNHGCYVAEALDAIVSQSLKPFEVLVCDDGSTDNSVEIIQRFVDKHPFVRLVRNDKNMGIFASSDRLTAMASGDYLYYASADDKILPGFLEKSMKLLQQYPQAGLCSTCTLRLDAGGKSKGVLFLPVIPCRNSFVPPSQALSMFYQYGSWMQGNTVIFKKQALMDSGGFIRELSSFCDGFIYHVIAVKYGVCFIYEPLAAWRCLESSYSSTIAKNPEVSLQWITHAKKLMATEYKDLFPLSFIERWEKRQLIDYQLSRNLSLQQREFKQMLHPGHLDLYYIDGVPCEAYLKESI